MKTSTVLVDEGILMPYWVTDKQDAILKVKDKFIGSVEPLEQGRVYSIGAEFESYCIEREKQEPIKGYFMKVPSMKSCAIEIDDTDEFYFPFKYFQIKFCFLHYYVFLNFKFPHLRS